MAVENQLGCAEDPLGFLTSTSDDFLTKIALCLHFSAIPRRPEWRCATDPRDGTSGKSETTPNHKHRHDRRPARGSHSGAARSTSPTSVIKRAPAGDAATMARLLTRMAVPPALMQGRIDFSARAALAVDYRRGRGVYHGMARAAQRYDNVLSRRPPDGSAARRRALHPETHGDSQPCVDGGLDESGSAYSARTWVRVGFDQAARAAAAAEQDQSLPRCRHQTPRVSMCRKPIRVVCPWPLSNYRVNRADERVPLNGSRSTQFGELVGVHDRALGLREAPVLLSTRPCRPSPRSSAR